MFVLGMLAGILLVMIGGGLFVVVESREQIRNREARRNDPQGRSLGL